MTEPTRPVPASRQAASIAGDRGGARRRRRVAAVGERVDHEVGHVPARRRAGSAPSGAPRRSARRRVETSPIRCTRSAPRSAARSVSFSASVPSRDRGVDPREVLRDDRAGAEVEVADLGVAHLPLGQPDGLALRGQRRVRVLGPQPVEHRRVGERDRVARAVGREAPAVEHDEADGRDASRAPRPPRSPRSRPGRGWRRRPARRRRRAARAARPRCRACTSRRRGSAPAPRRPCRGSRRARGRTRPPPAPARASRSGRCRSPRSARRRSTTSGSRSAGDLLEPLLDLVAQLALGLAALALLLGLADAEDRREPGLERLRDLELERLVGLVEVLRAARSGRGRRRATSISDSIGADTSPVYAPESASCMVCA